MSEASFIPLAPEPVVRLALPLDSPYADYEFYDAFVSEEGRVIVARRLDERVVFGSFLIDTTGAGVLEAEVRRMNPESFAEHVSDLSARTRLRRVPTGYACKLVLNAVDHAVSRGVRSTPDYANACHVLAGLDLSECEEAYEEDV